MTSRSRPSKILSGALALFVAMSDTGCVGAPPPDADDPVLAWASFRAVHPPGIGPLHVRFDVQSYARSLANEFAEEPLPGLVSALQFVRSLGDRIQLTLHFDTSDTGADVRKEMAPVLALMEVVPQTQAPPILELVWSDFEVSCVLESASAHFEEVDQTGRPVRAWLCVSLREYLTVQE